MLTTPRLAHKSDPSSAVQMPAAQVDRYPFTELKFYVNQQLKTLLKL